MKKIFTLKILLVLALLLSVAKLNAQVHMGADVAPQPFSVLELMSEYKTSTYGGLRLPQLDSIQRNLLSNTYGTQVSFEGLMIYNINTKCVEYWNKTRWISLCSGAADISLEGDNCTYDPLTPIPDDAEPCTYTPVGVPPCVISDGGQPYQIYLVSGHAFTNVQVVDGSTASFTVSFEENNTTYPRIAIVRVTSNCTGEFKDFPFIQPGADCPGGGAFLVTTNTTTLCGNTGGVIAYVTVPEEGMNYIWAFNGGVVHTGNYMQITRPGTYTVYPGLMGCEPKQVITITQNPGGTSPNPPIVQISNYGILCPTGSVTLTALNVSYPIQWFHNGILHSSTANPLLVSGAWAAGEWFAVQKDGDCGSRMSNIVNLIDQTTGSATLPDPIATVNGTLLTNTPPPVVCSGGTLELEVTNASVYPPGTVYEWFSNGGSIAMSTSPIIYTVPPSFSPITLSVQVSNNFGGCPNAATSLPIAITHIAPPPTIINNGDPVVAICGSTPAPLIALNESGVDYEWFRNQNPWFTGSDHDKVPSPPANTYRYDATEPDYYTVRYKDTNGCWSPVSTSIRVIQSAVITMEWKIVPNSPVTVGSEICYSVLASPNPNSYTWISSDLTKATIISYNDVACVRYVSTGTVNIQVEATNLCGTVSLDEDITIITSPCIQVTSVTIAPTGTVIRELNSSCVPISGHGSTGFTASTPGVTDQSNLTFTWYVNGVMQQTGLGATYATYNYTTPTIPGDYQVRVTVTDNCSPPNSRTSSNTIVRVTTCACVVDNSGNYRISGKVCYDVNQTNGTTANGCMPTAGRVNDFAGGYSFPNYRFESPTGQPFYVLEWSVTGPGGLASMPVNRGVNSSTLTFLSGIITQATGRDKNSALKFTITVKFCTTASSTSACATSGTGCRQVTLDVFVQDCACGCAVRSTLAGSGGWLTFMCYNLGANSGYTINQQVAYSPSSNTDMAVTGGLFQWGRTADGHQSRTSASHNGTLGVANLDAITGQPTGIYVGQFVRHTTGGATDWRSPRLNTLWNLSPTANTTPTKTNNDPCPVGWRVPTQAEWGSIVSGGTTAVTPSGGVANTASGNRWIWNTSGTTGFRVSPDGGTTTTLFLPAAGRRDGTGGSITDANIGGYWSSGLGAATDQSYTFRFANTTLNPAFSRGRSAGMSVRCVAE